MRSGVLVSVHSFATDPTRGLYILAFLVLTIGGSLTLYAWRAPKLYAPGGFELYSREFFLLVNNVILVGVAGLVLWGTLSPLVYELLGIGKISVGPPVFALMFLVPMFPLMVFLAIGMHSAWRRGKLTVTAKPLWWLRGRRGAVVGRDPRIAVQGISLGGPHRLQLRLLDHVFRGARTLAAAAPETNAERGTVGHVDRALGRRHVCHRRERRRELQNRERRRFEARRQLFDRRLRLQIRRRRQRARTELRRGARHASK